MINGKQRRLRRLFGEDDRALLIAMDHTVTLGPGTGLTDLGATMRAVVAGGADGVVSHRGSAARSMPAQRTTGLIIHLSGNTALSAGSELKTRVCDPETAVALGADAVSVHVTLGCGPAEDRTALADLGRVAAACDRLGLPLMVMTYVREAGGEQIVHSAQVAAELGADVVKVTHPGENHLCLLVESTPVPVVLAGGEAAGSWEDFLLSAKNAMGAGVAGLCVGRRVFGSADPARATAELRSIVHES